MLSTSIFQGCHVDDDGDPGGKKILMTIVMVSVMLMLDCYHGDVDDDEDYVDSDNDNDSDGDADHDEGDVGDDNDDKCDNDDHDRRTFHRSLERVCQLTKTIQKCQLRRYLPNPQPLFKRLDVQFWNNLVWHPRPVDVHVVHQHLLRMLHRALRRLKRLPRKRAHCEMLVTAC